MKIDGGCYCGKIKFEAEVDPADVRICHCVDCQIMSGAPYRANVPAAKANVRFTGEVKLFLKTAESGNKRYQAFCPECGTSMYSCAEKDPPVYTLRVGTIRQRAQLVPKSQQWCRSAVDWSSSLATVTERYELQRPGIR